MQVAAEVRRGRVKNHRSVKVDDLKIPFKFKTEVSAAATQEVAEVALALAKQVWIARVGGKVEERGGG